MERLIYSIVEVHDLYGNVVAYNASINYKGIAILSKEDGDKLISAIKKNGTFYKYNVNTTNTGKLCWTFYFEIAKKLPEPVKIEDKALYGHCPYCGSKTFVAVPRVPGSAFYYEGRSDEPDMICKHCRRILNGNDLLYGRYNK